MSTQPSHNQYSNLSRFTGGDQSTVRPDGTIPPSDNASRPQSSRFTTDGGGSAAGLLGTPVILHQDKAVINKAASSVADFIDAFDLLSKSGPTAQGEADVERASALALEALGRPVDRDRTPTNVIETLARLRGISNARSEKALHDLAESSRKSGRANVWAQGLGKKMRGVDSLLQSVGGDDW